MRSRATMAYRSDQWRMYIRFHKCRGISCFATIRILQRSGRRLTCVASLDGFTCRYQCDILYKISLRGSFHSWPVTTNAFTFHVFQCFTYGHGWFFFTKYMGPWPHSPTLLFLNSKIDNCSLTKFKSRLKQESTLLVVSGWQYGKFLKYWL